MVNLIVIVDFIPCHVLSNLSIGQTKASAGDV